MSLAKSHTAPPNSHRTMPHFCCFENHKSSMRIWPSDRVDHPHHLSEALRSFQNSKSAACSCASMEKLGGFLQGS